MTRPPEFWDGILRRLSPGVPAHEVEAWLRPLRADFDGREVRLSCPSALHRERVRTRYLAPLRAALAAESGGAASLSLSLGDVAKGLRADDRGAAPTGCNGVAGAEAAAAKRNGVAGAEAGAAGRNGIAGAEAGAAGRNGIAGAEAGAAKRNGVAAPEPGRALVPAPAGPPARMARAVQQTFDTFLVGPPNALAREAAFALAEARQREVNPLYLAGEGGQGKTHLARAVALAARGHRARVVYTSAEGFTSEFLGSLRGASLPGFKRRYRQECDVLVLEDVEFLRGKQSTQLELFHTVSHLLDTGARVVFTGARLPRQIPDLDRRLCDQMASGLVAEIGPPDAELRRRILRARAAAGGIRLPDDCLERLVEAVRGSVRDLESVLGQIVASAALLKQPVTLALTEAALRKLGGEAGAPLGLRRVAPREVIEMVAAFFRTTPEAMASRSRRRDVLLPRQLAMYLCRRFTDASLSEIGRALGRDHPAVANAVSAVERLILERAPLRYQVEALSDRLEHLRAPRG